jgi:RNA polymerase sigma-70 factor (ECF subfamily)
MSQGSVNSVSGGSHPEWNKPGSPWSVAGPGAEKPNFEDVYRALAPKLLAFLRSRCFGVVDADDVAQETWNKAFRSWDRFDGQNTKAWLYTIARNCLTDTVRRTARQPTTSLEIDVAETHYEISDEVAAVRLCVETVDGDFARVLRARIIEDRSVSDIAMELNIAEATVYTRVNRARKQVAECVKGKLAESE